MRERGLVCEHKAPPAGARFTVSARGKPPWAPVLTFLEDEFNHLPWDAVESVFGFVEPCTLYGGRAFLQAELSQRDVRALGDAGIGLRLPLSNHHVDRDEYERYAWLLEKYHDKGNSVIVTNDDLAAWVRRDFPRYEIEASVIKEIDTHAKIARALEVYDQIVLPMRFNEDLAFLEKIEEKRRITLFANAGCALTCPAKICYLSVSELNKAGGGVGRCSLDLGPRELLGFIDFDLACLSALGFSRFKLLRMHRQGLTSF